MLNVNYKNYKIYVILLQKIEQFTDFYKNFILCDKLAPCHRLARLLYLHILM